ncbi:MAG: hypothetical protein NTW16_11300 [Bacteroidetes bacterium]|nr:hypothetical protein [Bacteroidota bacterium]
MDLKSPYVYPFGLGSGWRLSVANSGRIYAQFFCGGNFAECDIYTSDRVNGQYQTPQKMGASINSDSMDIGAFIIMLFRQTPEQLCLEK